MSRIAFRADVDAPRPASAWLLVTVASATLWITEQLAPWVVAVQVALLLATLWRRESPIAWQRSGVALNVGMFAVVAVTVHVALRGGPSTIALAHFAALTQALQLFDARPRRTEFLLVAMALFQVVLASNLTDSVLFPPLLVAFVFATVWTLLVHTLRSEANEAGQSRALSGALTPGLARMTVLASAGAVALALLLFVALPRMRSNIVTGSGIGPVVATAGFSDHVELGAIGRIRQDSTVVMRVETLEGREPEPAERYWHGLAFDTFDGRSWSVTPSRRGRVAGSAEAGVTLGSRDDRIDLVQQIVREPVEAGVLFGIGRARGVQGTVRHLERDANGGLYAAGQADERIRYTIASERRRPGVAVLRRDRAAAPARGGDRYLALPPLDPAVAALAREITAGAKSDADRVAALERWLLSHGRYTDTPPPISEAGGSPVEAFLLSETAGHCEYFASALVVLARSLDIPARMVNGFAGGHRNRIGGFLELTRSDAHAWAEVHYERAGWVRYDATPPDLRARPEVALSLRERARELASAVELWWFQSIVGFDRSDQMHALKRAWLAWRGSLRDRSRPRLGETELLPDWNLDSGDRVPVRALLALGGVAVAAVLLLRHASRRGRRDALPPAYAEALRLLARRGLSRGVHVTARGFAREADERLPRAAAEAFSDLTEAYLAERFGGRDGRPAEGALRALRAGLAPGRGALRPARSR